MLSHFSDAFISRLNAQYGAGVFFSAATLVLDDTTRYYYANVPDPIVFDGHTYQPLPMQWEGLQQSSQMQLDTIRVTVSQRARDARTGEAGADDQVSQLLETTSLRGKTVILQILHHDLLTDMSAQYRTQRVIVTVEWSMMQGVFTLALDVGLNIYLPRRIMTRAEFPGIPDALRRASIL